MPSLEAGSLSRDFSTRIPIAMRAETQHIVSEIKQAVSLLRRHL